MDLTLKLSLLTHQDNYKIPSVKQLFIFDNWRSYNLTTHRSFIIVHFKNTYSLFVLNKCLKVSGIVLYTSAIRLFNQ